MFSLTRAKSLQESLSFLRRFCSWNFTFEFCWRIWSKNRPFSHQVQVKKSPKQDWKWPRQKWCFLANSFWENEEMEAKLSAFIQRVLFVYLAVCLWFSIKNKNWERYLVYTKLGTIWTIKLKFNYFLEFRKKWRPDSFSSSISGAFPRWAKFGPLASKAVSRALSSLRQKSTLTTGVLAIIMGIAKRWNLAFLSKKIILL